MANIYNARKAPRLCIPILKLRFPGTGRSQNRDLLALNEYLRPFQCVLLYVDVFQRCLTIHMTDLRHHHFQRDPGLST